MNILICHERFLFRFGADRVLILLGKGLAALGHRVTMMANRYDAEIVNSFAAEVIDVPGDRAPYLDLNEWTSDWLRENWDRLFALRNAPDVVIVGGWPFVSAVSFFRQVCSQVIFVDFGVVPIYGYPEPTVVTLQKLQALRRKHLPDASLIAGISNFIASSQSRPDSGGGVPVRSVLLGADHMEMSIWPAAQLQAAGAAGSALELVESLKRQGRKVVLCLGRWEPGCYKNSQAAFRVMETLLAAHPLCSLLILERPEKVEIPAPLRSAILPIGFPDDDELIAVMKQADLGISLSEWEGFNLPLAEMQWFGRPALAFEVGAHPEVIAHPWFLCRDAAEMSLKAAELLLGGGPDRTATQDALERFRNYFRWERFIDEYAAILKAENGTRSPVPLLIDVSNSARDIANSGVVRVTRRLSRELQNNGEDPIFAVWDPAATRYVLPTRAEHEVLSCFNGPLLRDPRRLSESQEHRTGVDEILSGSAAGWLLVPELVMESSFQHIRRFARDRGMNIAAIFYDSIPVLRPDLCNDQVRNNHRQYMAGLAECDLAIPISQFSAKCLADFWRESHIEGGCRIAADVLPGEFGSPGRRSTSTHSSGSGQIKILCVSTLEPRKNHRNLIQACLWMAEQHPDLDWSLTLVGNRYEGAFELAEWVRDVSAKNPRIQWLGIVDDETLDRLYRECAFTVYPSVIEGFGLPIVESIWHGRPCICYHSGVMAELADGGGCLTTDVTDPIRLAEAIYTLAGNDGLRAKLSSEAAARPLKSWREYVVELLDSLATQPRAHGSGALTAGAQGGEFASWEQALYPNCLCEKWQMNHSERMALTGLLARHSTGCSIEVGTYCAGSLSLISQYSKMVFSIDIDETIPSRFRFPNVSFLTGPSSVILPHLLRELDDAGIPLEFMLIDGDHSAAGIMSDVECLLQYVPKKPLFVVLHDSLNPECRRGMLAAGWQRSPYCHWVEIDFVPGRVIEHGGLGDGELWGGLAAAYFLPAPRKGELQIGQSAKQLFARLSAPAVKHATARA